VEKAPEIGAHTLSGAIIETKGLDKLFPDWKEMEGCPVKQPVKKDSVNRYFSQLNLTLEFSSQF
jgi:electron-transferring-flavoprotein dehydrogenase